MKIGVFDSGVGGLSVANAIRDAYPEHTVVYKNDSKHVPYSQWSRDQLLSFVVPILQGLVTEGCEIIVIACNTVSTTILDDIKCTFTVSIIGVEPLIKEACELTKKGVIAVCATPATLASERYALLLKQFAPSVEVLQPDCADWSYLIEQNALEHQRIERDIEAVLQRGADVIVLGCTHYHWIEDDIKTIAQNRAVIVQPEQKVVEQIRAYVLYPKELLRRR